MVIEHVALSIHEGQNAEFEAAMRAARTVLQEAPGSHSVIVARGVESPSQYLLMVEWDSVEAHVAFTKSEGIATFRSLVGRFFAERPQMQHFSPLFNS